MRVLFVDDEEPIRSVFARSMSDRGFVVDTAAAPAEALRAVRKHSYAVVVTDLRMPGLHGLSLIERIKPIRPYTTFVVVTGIPDLDLPRIQSIDSSIVSIMEKPWASEEMESVLQVGMELYRKRAQDARQQTLQPTDLALLVVEDNPGDAALVRHYLADLCESAGPIVNVHRLNEAIELLHEQSFRVVITDLSLPDARGLDAVRRIQIAAPDAPIIVLSETDDDAVALQAVQLGAQDYLIKARVDRHTLDRAIRFATERKRAERRLARLARFDELTELPNRTTFKERLSQALARARRQYGRFGVMFLDLDRFKSVNDDLGHNAGDELLKEVALRLADVVRESDTVARLGGDEFAILAERIEESDAVTELAERILEETSRPVRMEASEVSPTVSIGIALYPDHADSSDGLLKAADGAMYRAKDLGRNNFQVYSRKTANGGMARLRLEGELRSALERGQFCLHYQPQVDLKTGKLIGMEALLRWKRPDGGRISPTEFVPLLEDMGLIHDVGNWALSAACEELKRLRDTTTPGLRMSVNLSPRQFEGGDLLRCVAQALERADLDPQTLELEITEGLLMRDTRTTNETLSGLKKIGVRIAIDDFGTGYSSLAYLHRFAVDTLKIDRSFVGNLRAGNAEAFITGAIVSLGHRLGLQVVAEGVETPHQLEYLREEGCDIVQGFLCGHPAPRHLN